MKWLKWVAGAAAVVATLGGLVWLADLRGGGSTTAQAQSASTAVDVETLIAQKTGLTTDTLHKLEAAGLAVAADKGTTQGVITPAQATSLQNLKVGDVLNRALEATAAAANVQDTDLVGGLNQGKSLAQITALPADQLKANLTAALQKELSTDGSFLTPAQTAMITTMFTSNLDKIVNHVPDQKTP